MITMETLNELTLKVTAQAGDILFTKAGAFVAGESPSRNYRFEKVLLGPQNSVGRALLGSVVRRVTGENIPLMKVTFSGDSVTYYANQGQHVVVYRLDQGEMISVESENLLAFSADCDYNVRFIGVGVLSQKGFATTAITARGPSAFVAVLCDGNPIVLSNVYSRSVLMADPDAVVCWIGMGPSDPAVRADVNWKTFIGQASGESYSFEWSGAEPVTVIVQPTERGGGIRVSMD